MIDLLRNIGAPGGAVDLRTASWSLPQGCMEGSVVVAFIRNLHRRLRGPRLSDATFDTYLHVLRAKWAELPPDSDAGERRFSTDLLTWSDDKLLAYWDEQLRASEDLRGWYRALYAPLLRGKRVLEIGSGMGFDGLYFLQHGAEWQPSDIVADNQRLIQRLAQAKGLQPLGFLHIDSLAAFEQLPHDFDVVWAIGSLIHLPFALAAEECAEIIKHLKPGGRWIELTYPFERWAREGGLPFSEWGKVTDGERTPWVEWYDAEKLRQRLAPHVMTPIMDLHFSSNNFNWIDMIYTGERAPPPMAPVELPPPPPITTPTEIWSYAHRIAVRDLLRMVDGSVSADITCKVTSGSIGFAFLTTDGTAFTGREQMLNARGLLQRVTITGAAASDAIVIRNTSGHGPSRVEIETITLRSAL